jgi:hypothetical protein
VTIGYRPTDGGLGHAGPLTRARRGQGTHVVLLVTCWWIAFVLIYNYAVLPRAREVTDSIQMANGPIDYGTNTEVGFRSGCRLRDTVSFRKY